MPHGIAQPLATNPAKPTKQRSLLASASLQAGSLACPERQASTARLLVQLAQPAVAVAVDIVLAVLELPNVCVQDPPEEMIGSI